MVVLSFESLFQSKKHVGRAPKGTDEVCQTPGNPHDLVAENVSQTLFWRAGIAALIKALRAILQSDRCNQLELAIFFRYKGGKLFQSGFPVPNRLWEIAAIAAQIGASCSSAEA